MSKTGYGNWKGPFPDAEEGTDYRNPCGPGEELVRGFRKRDGTEVPAYCRKKKEKEDVYYRNRNPDVQEAIATRDNPNDAIEACLAQFESLPSQFEDTRYFEEDEHQQMRDVTEVGNRKEFYFASTYEDPDSGKIYDVSGRVQKKRHGKWEATASAEEADL